MQLHIDMKKVMQFWHCVDDSYTVERMYEDHENIRVTLSTYRNGHFLLFKGNESKGDTDSQEAHIVNENGTSLARFWRLGDGNFKGSAQGTEGLKEVDRVLHLFEKSLKWGDIELIAERNEETPALFVPLSDEESDIVTGLKNGRSIDAIQKDLNLNHSKLKKIRKSLVRKGVISRSLEELCIG